MRIIRGKYGGFCFGVKRAINMAFERSESDKNSTISTLGPIIHNPQVVKDLEEHGVQQVNSLDELETSQPQTVIIRSHGVGPQAYREAEQQKVEIVDATCPYVKRIHVIVTDLVEQGYQVVIVGEPDHPEVRAIRAYADEKAVVVEIPDDLEQVDLSRKIGVVAQTTQSQDRLQSIVWSLLEKRNSEVRIFNTICDATDVRQKEAVELAQQSDAIIVIGGRKSGNTTRLAKICSRIQPQTFHIETAAEIDPAWLQGKSAVGVTAGASTPNYLIEEVVNVLETLAQHSGSTEKKI
ncbi:4-hydroxy-3-methylbut-2-enyl diphosphate reductase [Desulfurispira natronophila]|uniref:4-hydroxy-3-methylbut-2-enyl diphosphate reductase n=1 Tax=Desulfurispira natronophila TaxID=682562 RepID=A0A7W7Y478_9BACT|nr:4-hydroxy-3-methylbut-2-enyl diphosphate reductase [Desulfurispira natronophila]MBB5021727.1 4-hydroxy-3-methylbut-2-enyl diphosphate reductase [Desulfurispira natronophila]